WEVRPSGTEGYAKAEVTLGGVDTDELSSKTMESRRVAGLYFIGEIVDVTGWLGGYNFQWAWASGFAAGQGVVGRVSKGACNRRATILVADLVRKLRGRNQDGCSTLEFPNTLEEEYFPRTSRL